VLSIRCLIFLLLAGIRLEAVTLNTQAPSFSLLNLSHEKKTLSNYRGKIVFVNFWASWCAPCIEELPELQRLASDYNGKKLKVIGINVDQDKNAAKKLISQLGLSTSSIEILWDSKSKVVNTYSIEGMPSSFIIDPKGIIRFTHIGFHHNDPETWRHEINQLNK